MKAIRALRLLELCCCETMIVSGTGKRTDHLNSAGERSSAAAVHANTLNMGLRRVSPVYGIPEEHSVYRPPSSEQLNLAPRGTDTKSNIADVDVVDLLGVRVNTVLGATVGVVVVVVRVVGGTATVKDWVAESVTARGTATALGRKFVYVAITVKS